MFTGVNSKSAKKPGDVFSFVVFSFRNPETKIDNRSDGLRVSFLSRTIAPRVYIIDRTRYPTVVSSEFGTYIRGFVNNGKHVDAPRVVYRIARTT